MWLLVPCLIARNRFYQSVITWYKWKAGWMPMMMKTLSDNSARLMLRRPFALLTADNFPVFIHLKFQWSVFSVVSNALSISDFFKPKIKRDIKTKMYAILLLLFFSVISLQHMKAEKNVAYWYRSISVNCSNNTSYSFTLPMSGASYYSFTVPPGNNSFGPIDAGTYNIYISNGSSNTYTYYLNGSSQTSSGGASFNGVSVIFFIPVVFEIDW